MSQTRRRPSIFSKSRRRYRRAVEPNQGNSRKYANLITQSINRVNQALILVILYNLRSSNYAGRVELAQDAGISDWIKGFTKKAADTAAALMVKAQNGIKAAADWFTNATVRDTTTAQKDALKTAGMSEGFIAEHWTEPTDWGQYVAPEVRGMIPGFIRDQTELISKIGGRELQKIQDIMAESLQAGVTITDIERLLRSVEGFDPARATRVALDQSIKLNQAIQRGNDLALGITEAVWIHVPGQYTSREAHIKLNGQAYDLRTGIYDPEVEKNIQCGELPFCRCIYRAKMPELIANVTTPPLKAMRTYITEAPEKKGQLELEFETKPRKRTVKKKRTYTRHKKATPHGVQMQLDFDMAQIEKEFTPPTIKPKKTGRKKKK